jgi:hypothetical protein
MMNGVRVGEFWELTMYLEEIHPSARWDRPRWTSIEVELQDGGHTLAECWQRAKLFGGLSVEVGHFSADELERPLELVLKYCLIFSTRNLDGGYVVSCMLLPLQSSELLFLNFDLSWTSTWTAALETA